MQEIMIDEFDIDEIILKCQIGEEHLDQAEYEQVAKWLEVYKEYKANRDFCMGHIDVSIKDTEPFKEILTAFKLACESLNDTCINADFCIANCPLNETEICRNGEPCPGNFVEAFIKKAREKNDQ